MAFSADRLEVYKGGKITPGGGGSVASGSAAPSEVDGAETVSVAGSDFGGSVAGSDFPGSVAGSVAATAGSEDPPRVDESLSALGDYDDVASQATSHSHALLEEDEEDLDSDSDGSDGSGSGSDGSDGSDGSGSGSDDDDDDGSIDGDKENRAAPAVADAAAGRGGRAGRAVFRARRPPRGQGVASGATPPGVPVPVAAATAAAAATEARGGSRG